MMLLIVTLIFRLLIAIIVMLMVMANITSMFIYFPNRDFVLEASSAHIHYLRIMPQFRDYV